MNTKLSKRRIAWAAIALVLLTGVTVWLFHDMTASKKIANAPAPAVQVTLASVRQQDVPIFLAGIGTVTAAATVTVRARVDGQLEKVGFTEGQDVVAGQLIAQIDPRSLQAQLGQSQAQKGRDQALLANARADLKRYVTLMEQDATSQQTLDTQRSLVAQLEAALQTDDAQINYAQVQLGFTRIVAPISGRVGARLVDAGNIVHASDANGLVVINQIDPITLVFTLPEESFQEINRASQASHQPLSVVVYPRDSDTAIATGKLILVNNQIDTTSGTVQLKASFANASHNLWPGQYVNVRLLLGVRKDVLTVPAAVVQRSQEGTYAYVVGADNKAQSQPIHVVQIQDGIAVVDKGLATGENVVLDGQYKLKPGVQVTTAAPKAAAPKATAANPAASSADSKSEKSDSSAAPQGAGK